MKKYLFVLMLLPMLMMGCEDGEILNRKPVVRTYENDSVRLSFWLETSEGKKATVFLHGEDIVMHYQLKILASDTMHLAIIYCNPFESDINCSAIYNSSNEKLVPTRADIIMGDEYGYKAYAPGDVVDWTWSYPNDYNDEFIDYIDWQPYSYLPKGRYYTGFQPRLAYYSKSPFYEPVDAIVVKNIPKFHIDFKVK